MGAFLKKVEAYVKKDGTVVPDRKDKTIHKPAKAKKAKKVKNQKRGIIAPFKPAKANKPQKARKFDKTVKPGAAHADDQDLLKSSSPKSNTNLLHLRKLIPRLEKMASITNPFDLTDPTWISFLREAGPEVMATLLWDLGKVELNDSRSRRDLMIALKKHIIK